MVQVQQEQAPARDVYRLRAHEIWGGNEATRKQLTVPGFEAYVYSAPYRGGSGGDLNFVSSCAMGQIVRFTVADIAGHGEGAQDWALTLRRLIRKHMNTPNPAKFARALNWEFSRLAESGGFATALITTYFAPTDHLIVCNAGHPRPLLHRAREGRWELFDEGVSQAVPASKARDTGINGLPLGVMPSTSYPLIAARMEPGDVFVAYTDAISEAADTSGRELGEQGLLSLVSGMRGVEPAGLGPAILDAVAKRRGSAAATDDTTVMVLHHTATDPPSGPIARLKALGRLVGLVE